MSTFLTTSQVSRLPDCKIEASMIALYGSQVTSNSWRASVAKYFWWGGAGSSMHIAYFRYGYYVLASILSKSMVTGCRIVCSLAALSAWVKSSAQHRLMTWKAKPSELSFRLKTIPRNNWQSVQCLSDQCSYSNQYQGYCIRFSDSFHEVAAHFKHKVYSYVRYLPYPVCILSLIRVVFHCTTPPTQTAWYFLHAI